MGSDDRAVLLSRNSKSVVAERGSLSIQRVMLRWQARSVVQVRPLRDLTLVHVELKEITNALEAFKSELAEGTSVGYMGGELIKSDMATKAAKNLMRARLLISSLQLPSPGLR